MGRQIVLQTARQPVFLSRSRTCEQSKERSGLRVKVQTGEMEEAWETCTLCARYSPSLKADVRCRFFNTCHNCQPCIEQRENSKASLPHRSARTGNPQKLADVTIPSPAVQTAKCFFFLSCARNIRNLNNRQNSYRIAKTLNITKTQSPFVCLGYSFSLRCLQITHLANNGIKWTLLTLSSSPLQLQMHSQHSILNYTTSIIQMFSP